MNQQQHTVVLAGSLLRTFCDGWQPAVAFALFAAFAFLAASFAASFAMAGSLSWVGRRVWLVSVPQLQTAVLEARDELYYIAGNLLGNRPQPHGGFFPRIGKRGPCVVVPIAKVA